jgi:hypothetical protein
MTEKKKGENGVVKRRRRTPKIIEDKKERGQWAESVFTARAEENRLPVSRPFGDAKSFDCVVGRPGRFVAVQVKSTVTKLRNGKGYICSVCSCHEAYEAGAFDFLAAYVVPEDVWYILPAKLIQGLKSISLGTADGGEAKYEKYREAWHLLRKKSGGEERARVTEEIVASPAVARMQGAFGSMRCWLAG